MIARPEITELLNFGGNTMNMTAICITAIICATLVIICWMGKGEDKGK